MSNPGQTPPRGRGRGRAPIRRIAGQEPQPPARGIQFGPGGGGAASCQGGASVPAGRGIPIGVPPGVQSVAGGGGPTDVLRIGGVSGSGIHRKRARDGEDGAGPSGPVRGGTPAPPAPPLAVAPPPPPPPPPPAGAEGQGMFYCNLCNRHFDTDRGLCGHLRTHMDRGYRGAFPPPIFTRQEFIDEGVEHLLNPVDGGDEVAEQGGGDVVDPPPAAGGGEEGGGGAPPAGPNVVERREEEAAAEASRVAQKVHDFDLNDPAPQE